MWYRTLLYAPGASRPRSCCGCSIDWFKTDTTYTEELLTSSREGELEAVAEEHTV